MPDLLNEIKSTLLNKTHDIAGHLENLTATFKANMSLDHLENAAKQIVGPEINTAVSEFHKTVNEIHAVIDYVKDDIYVAFRIVHDFATNTTTIVENEIDKEQPKMTDVINTLTSSPTVTAATDSVSVTTADNTATAAPAAPATQQDESFNFDVGAIALPELAASHLFEVELKIANTWVTDPSVFGIVSTGNNLTVSSILPEEPLDYANIEALRVIYLSKAGKPLFGLEYEVQHNSSVPIQFGNVHYDVDTSTSVTIVFGITITSSSFIAIKDL